MKMDVEPIIEYLDIYDENMNHIGIESRSKVHECALWHKTVHCWLYDKNGNIYFQIRSDEKKLYTTASGHVLANESIKQAFGREIKEEIGIDINYDSAVFVNMIPFIMDKTKNDGIIFRDRAFSNIYLCELNDQIQNTFHFDINEVNGLVKLNAKEVIELFLNNKKAINAEYILEGNETNFKEQRQVTSNDFLLNKNETLEEKYGAVLKKVIELTNK